MALPTVNGANYPDPDEIRGGALSDIRYSGAISGITINVAKGSDQYFRTKAFADVASIPIANNRIALQAASPLEATGADLEAQAALRGITRRPANPASGLVLIETTRWGSTYSTVTIPTGFVCTSGDGIQYATTSAVTVTNGDAVAVEAETTGEVGNQTAGTILTWDSAAIGQLKQTCTVAQGGLGDGADADDDETLRQRLLRRLQFAAAGGNPAQTNDWAEEASSAIEVAFTYPAARGPSSYDVAIVSNDDDRIASAATVTRAAANILANMPGQQDLVCTTVAAESADMIVDIDLPLPVNAGGAGGGFRDASPWPSDAETGVNVYAEITGVTLASRQIVVNSTSADPPVAGKRFAVWNPTGGDDELGDMHEFTIQSVAGVSGAYIITIDATSDSIAFLEVGMFCSAGAYNLKSYALAMRDAMRALGPGEKTTNTDILPRAKRNPGPDVVYPSEITNLILSDVSDDYSEILDIEYAAVIETGTGASGTGTFVDRTSPSVPATTADPPHLLTLSALSFRRKV